MFTKDKKPKRRLNTSGSHFKSVKKLPNTISSSVFFRRTGSSAHHRTSLFYMCKSLGDKKKNVLREEAPATRLLPQGKPNEYGLD